jgi:hypothetical protein
MRCDLPPPFTGLSCRDAPPQNHPHFNTTTNIQETARSANRHTADAVRNQLQIYQPGQVAQWIERACDCPTPPPQHANTTLLSTDYALKRKLRSRRHAHRTRQQHCADTCLPHTTTTLRRHMLTTHDNNTAPTHVHHTRQHHCADTCLPHTTTTLGRHMFTTHDNNTAPTHVSDNGLHEAAVLPTLTQHQHHDQTLGHSLGHPHSTTTQYDAPQLFHVSLLP